MMRLLSDGMLIGYGSFLLLLLVPMAGTLLAHGLWFGLWSFIEWRVPDSKKVKAAREQDRQTILVLKEQLCDTLAELVKLKKSEGELRGVAELMRNSNRNLNAKANEALK
jgi:hypothetical protein